VLGELAVWHQLESAPRGKLGLKEMALDEFWAHLRPTNERVALSDLAVVFDQLPDLGGNLLHYHLTVAFVKRPEYQLAPIDSQEPKAPVPSWVPNYFDDLSHAFACATVRLRLKENFAAMQGSVLVGLRLVIEEEELVACWTLDGWLTAELDLELSLQHFFVGLALTEVIKHPLVEYL